MFTFRMWVYTVAPLLLAFAAPMAAESIGGCQVFPTDNVWNVPINTLPVDPNSNAYINTIGASTPLHPDFSSTGAGIPFNTVPGTQPLVPITFYYADESDPGPYPIPPKAHIESGSDHHVLVLDSGTCELYEVDNASKNANNSWNGDSGAIFNLSSDALRPAGWTSADAAGLPILPGLIRYSEVNSGKITHALRMTAPQTRDRYIWPARHYASSLTGAQYPPMGQRFRLKASFDISPFPASVQVILNALKTYGAFLADNGSPWYLSGVPNKSWNDNDMHQLGNVIGSDMEAVDESSLIVNPNSGQTAPQHAVIGH